MTSAFASRSLLDSGMTVELSIFAEVMHWISAVSSLVGSDAFAGRLRTLMGYVRVDPVNPKSSPNTSFPLPFSLDPNGLRLLAWPMVSTGGSCESWLVVSNIRWYQGSLWASFRRNGTQEQIIKVLTSASDHMIGTARSCVSSRPISVTECIRITEIAQTLVALISIRSESGQLWMIDSHQAK